MKFGKIIQDLAVKGHNENFRFLRHPHHVALLWDQIHGELWLKWQVSQHWPLKNSANPPKRKADFVPKGYLIRIASVFLVVLLSAFATGVRGLIQFQNLIFVAHQKLPVLSSNLPSPPHRHPSISTQVKVEVHPFSFHFWIFFIWFYSRLSGSLASKCKSRTAMNLMSALDNQEPVDAKLQKELEAHRLAGAFQCPPLSPFWISPLGLVPKVSGRILLNPSFVFSDWLLC